MQRNSFILNIIKTKGAHKNGQNASNIQNIMTQATENINRDD
jgi:hypothetical protein